MPSSSEHHRAPATSDGSPKGTGSNYSMSKVAEHPRHVISCTLSLCAFIGCSLVSTKVLWPEPSPYTCLLLLTHISFLFLFWKENEGEVLTEGDCQVQH